jgi:hypothetical protein
VNRRTGFVDIAKRTRDIASMPSRFAPKAKKSSVRGIGSSRAWYG